MKIVDEKIIVFDHTRILACCIAYLIDLLAAGMLSIVPAIELVHSGGILMLDGALFTEVLTTTGI